MLNEPVVFVTKIAQVYVKQLLTFCFSKLLAITVMFNETMYFVDENAGPAQPVLVLSNPSSMTFNVTVTNADGSATGEYCSNLINY